MGLKICSLFSGSTGNCTFVTDGTTKILIDAGVPHTKIERALKVLGYDANILSVLVTHCHTDHTVGLPKLLKNYPDTVVYAHERVAGDGMLSSVPSERIRVFSGADFFVGGITVSPFELSHDVFCVGYALTSGGKKFSYITDTGVIAGDALGAVQGSDVIMLESNHSVDLLINGKYPPQLKRRILSSRGHLSNEACAEAAVKFARSGAKYIILAHLSQENNYPELAYSVTRSALDEAGCGSVALEVASPDKMSGLIEIV